MVLEEREASGFWSTHFKSVCILAFVAFLFWGLASLVIRLHLTQMAYEFDTMKRYQRSLKEEELRLRAELAERLSISHIHSPQFREPEPDQVVRLP